MEPSSDDERKILTDRADRARLRLTSMLSTLDRRRREVLDLPLQVTKHAQLVGVVGAACVSGFVAYGIYRAVTAASRRREERWRLVQRVWDHPERAAKREPSLTSRLARAALMGLARVVVTKLLAGAKERAVAHENATPLALPEARYDAQG